MILDFMHTYKEKSKLFGMISQKSVRYVFHNSWQLCQKVFGLSCIFLLPSLPIISVIIHLSAVIFMSIDDIIIILLKITISLLEHESMRILLTVHSCCASYSISYT